MGNVIVLLLVLSMAAVFVSVVWAVQQRRAIRKLAGQMAQLLEGQKKLVLNKLDRIIEGQRLSVTLRLEPSSLKVSPQEFEANKPALKTRMLNCLDSEDHPSPDTKAYLILDRSGLALFLNNETRNKVQAGLGRLLANNDKTTGAKFLEEVVDKL